MHLPRCSEKCPCSSGLICPFFIWGLMYSFAILFSRSFLSVAVISFGFRSCFLVYVLVSRFPFLLSGLCSCFPVYVLVSRFPFLFSGLCSCFPVYVLVSRFSVSVPVFPSFFSGYRLPLPASSCRCYLEIIAFPLLQQNPHPPGTHGIPHRRQ